MENIEVKSNKYWFRTMLLQFIAKEGELNYDKILNFAESNYVKVSMVMELLKHLLNEKTLKIKENTNFGFMLNDGVGFVFVEKFLENPETYINSSQFGSVIYFVDNNMDVVPNNSEFFNFWVEQIQAKIKYDNFLNKYNARN